MAVATSATSFPSNRSTRETRIPSIVASQRSKTMVCHDEMGTHRKRNAEIRGIVGQSQILKQFYASNSVWSKVGLDGNPGYFQLAFANEGTSKYCSDAPDCTNGN